MIESLRHPQVPSAITRNDVAPGVNYVTYVPKGDVVERGTFTSFAEYDGESDERWRAQASVKTGQLVIEKTVLLFDAGITPSETGDRWSDRVTVIDDTEE